LMATARPIPEPAPVTIATVMPNPCSVASE
jgi:hypothetical protein